MGDSRTVTIDPENPDPAVIEEAVAVLEAGGLVVAPTETRYGLLARADKGLPAERLTEVKRRSETKPISVFVGSFEMIMHYARMNPTSQRLAQLFLPGPLTLVVPAIGTWHEMIVPQDKIGIRVSSSPVIQAIMERVDFPVTATSANISGEDEAETVSEIAEAFEDGVDLYLDSGRLAGMPSTVVECIDETPKILREGAIDPNEIMAAVKE